MNRMTRADMTKAIEHLKEGLARDPQYALLWAELGSVLARSADGSWIPAAEGYARAREAVDRALALEPELAEGYASLAWIQRSYDWDFRGAEASIARALELAPASADVLRIAGTMARTNGRFEEAIGLFRRALEQDPLSANTYDHLGLALHAADRPAEAEVAYRKTLELSPQRIRTRALLALSLLAQGRREEALAEASRESEGLYHLWALAIVEHGSGHIAESDAALDQLIEKNAADGAYQIAALYGARGEADKAFEWLERAYAQRDSGLPEAKTTPRLRPLHGDPRWGAFLEKMGL